MHATEFLKSPPQPFPGCIALFGEERSLKLSSLELITKLTLGPDETPTRLPGKDLDFQDVKAELLTIPMFGGKRIIVVEDANDFVSDNRSALETYAAKPAKKSLLVLDLKAFQATTKLYKQVNSTGLVIDCSPLKAAALHKWIQETAQREYGKSLAGEAVGLLLELVGTGMGHLEQELAKLAAYVGDKSTIDADAVRKLVGDWRTETTWAMTDAVRDGRLPDALFALDKLLQAGDPPLKIHGGLAFVFRKLSVATELSRQGVPLNDALSQAGAWGGEIGAATRYLRQVGRPKAEKISRQLLDADVGLKGGSTLPERAQLELLLARLAGSVD